METIEVVAALIRDRGGRVLLVRKRDEMIWIDPATPTDIHLAPLTRDHLLPLAFRERGATHA